MAASPEAIHANPADFHMAIAYLESLVFQKHGLPLNTGVLIILTSLEEDRKDAILAELDAQGWIDTSGSEVLITEAGEKFVNEHLGGHFLG